jgi:hypothetical protein
MTAGEPFTPRTLGPDKAPRPPTHHKPPAEKPDKPMLIPKPKGAFQWPPDCLWPFTLPEMTDGAAMPSHHRAQSRHLRPLSTFLLALLLLQGCNVLNPLCGSARPAPIIGALSPSTITFAEVQKGFVLTVNGSQFVSASIVVINGITLSTLATSSKQLQGTITTAVISAAGVASVTVNTPSGNSGNLGCTSGGTSHALVLTIT